MILSLCGVGLPVEDETGHDVCNQNERQEDKAGSPRLLMPIFIRRDGVGINHHGQ